MKTKETQSSGSLQRRVRALDADYNRAVTRLLKLSEKIASAQRKYAAQEKDIKAIERELNKLTKGQDMSLRPNGPDQTPRQ